MITHVFDPVWISRKCTRKRYWTLSPHNLIPGGSTVTAANIIHRCLFTPRSAIRLKFSAQSLQGARTSGCTYLYKLFTEARRLAPLSQVRGDRLALWKLNAINCKECRRVQWGTLQGHPIMPLVNLIKPRRSSIAGTKVLENSRKNVCPVSRLEFILYEMVDAEQPAPYRSPRFEYFTDRCLNNYWIEFNSILFNETNPKI